MGIRDSLAPQGRFILQEWDDPGHPVSFSIYFDFCHDVLFRIIAAGSVPYGYNLEPCDTHYASVAGWISEVTQRGFVYKRAEGLAPYIDQRVSERVWLDSAAQSTKFAIRSFRAVFSPDS